MRMLLASSYLQRPRVSVDFISDRRGKTYTRRGSARTSRFSQNERAGISLDGCVVFFADSDS